MLFSSRLQLLALAAAFWPVWRWMIVRSADSSGDAWELASLAAAVMFLLTTPKPAQPVNRSSALPIALLVSYAATYVFVPPLLRGCIAVTAIAAACSGAFLGKRMDLPLLGLSLLSLPVIASLNFYLGYPLRVAVGAVAAALLQMNGFAVVREGALLEWNGQWVSIDAPCSGIKMLWAGLFLSCTLAAFMRLDARRTVELGAIAVALVLLANVMRAAAMFFIEVGVVRVGESWHAGVGVVVFAMAALAVGSVARRIKGVGDVA